MHRPPRNDLLRAEVDNIHAKYFCGDKDFKLAHKNFAKAVRQAFSPITECSAISYANSAYNADISNIVQHFNVEKNGNHFDIILIVGDENANYVAKKQFAKSYKCVEKAMQTCRVLNLLFNFNEQHHGSKS